MPPRSTLSIVLPNYNHARHLPRAIEGFLQQTRFPDELLILDDGSTDDSAEIIESYARRHGVIRFLRNETNEGVAPAHARLFAASHGDYIHPAAADDLRSPKFCEATMSLAEQYPQAGLIFGAAAIIDEQDRTVSVLKSSRWSSPLYAGPESYLRDYLEVELATQSATTSNVYRRDALLEAGGYRPELGSWGDTFLTHAIGLKYGACYTPEVISMWRRAAGTVSGAGRADPRTMLDMASRAANLMRSDEFRGRFPESYVRRWEREFRRLTVWSYWLGEDRRDASGNRPGFWKRNAFRLPRTSRALSLLFYRGGER
jgi:glycosyltransferase involved in cell wall biosynthesis